MFLAVASIAVILAQACTPMGKVEGISPGQSSVDRSLIAVFTVSGTGPCALFRIYWGDGTYDEDGANYSGAWSNHERHVYTGWGGTKTVTAEGTTNCAGSAQTSIQVNPQVWREALDLRTPIPESASDRSCVGSTSLPILRKDSTVMVTTSPVSSIDFGCILGGCVYGIDGEPNSVAPADYPFPGLRKYSLVIKVGSQIVQGGNNVTFTANETEALQLCINDNVLAGDSGVWGAFFEVTEPAK